MSELFELTPGAVIGRDYRVLKKLASGGMGAVFVAEQVSTGTQRALKVMHPQLVSDARACERFVQEARLGGMIRSDHVVEVVGAGVDEARNLPWLAMELLEGEDLSSRLERAGRLPPSEVLALFDQLCDALSRAHALGIVHRDLKPENLFIARPRRRDVPFTLKVLDFGIARLLQEGLTAAQRTAAVGSPLWMAPEQATEGGSVGPSADVWALGLIAFELLTGKCYWRTANRGGAGLLPLLTEIATETLAPASVRAEELGCAGLLPPGFDPWFSRCVARSPGDRFPQAGEAWTALRSALAASPQEPLGLLPTQALPSGALPSGGLPAAPPATLAGPSETLLMTRAHAPSSEAGAGESGRASARGRRRVMLGAVGVFLVLVLAAVGVGLGLGARARGRRFETVARARAEEVALVPLPDAGAVALPSPGPLVRAVLTARAIELDHAARVASWPERAREGFLGTLDEAWAGSIPLVYRDLVALREGRVAPTDKRGGAFGFLVLPLQQRAHDLMELEAGWARFVGSAPSRGVVVYAAPQLPSRTVFEALYTLANAGYAEQHLALHTASGVRAFGLGTEPPGGREGRLRLTLAILAQGYSLSAAGGGVLPGCAEVGPVGVTVPLLTTPGRDRDYDLEGLRRCMGAVRDRWAEEVREDPVLRVSAGSTVPYGVLAATLATVRERSPGACGAASVGGDDGQARGCLFPEVVLGVLSN